MSVERSHFLEGWKDSTKMGLKMPAEPNKRHCDRATNPGCPHIQQEAICVSSSAGYF